MKRCDSPQMLFGAEELIRRLEKKRVSREMIDTAEEILNDMTNELHEVSDDYVKEMLKEKHGSR